MNNLWLIIKREYWQRVRTKGFIISTILTPLLLGGMMFVPGLLFRMQTGEQKRVAVIDQPGIIYDDLVQALNERAERGRPRFLLSKVEAAGNLEAATQALKDKINRNALDGYLIIDRDIVRTKRAVYHAKNVSNFVDLRLLNDTLNSVVIKKRLSQEGLDESRVKDLIKRTDLKTIKITREGETEEKGQTFAISYALVIILYASLIFYGVAIMRGVLEEKSSRIVEVIISSVRPFELMLGKLIGVGAVGLTQMFVWGVLLTLFSLYGVMAMAVFSPQALPKMDIPPSVLVYFILFFILGYFLFGSMYTALGAMINSEQEAQQAQIPILSFLVIPLVMMPAIINNPNSPLSTTLSLIPFFAPLLMFMRICILMPPFLQILASIVLLALTTLFIVWLVAKIYRVGILMYGKRPSIPELVKWLKYS